MSEPRWLLNKKTNRLQTLGERDAGSGTDDVRSIRNSITIYSADSVDLGFYIETRHSRGR